MQLPDTETPQVVSQNVILDKDLKQVVMMQCQVRHLETKGEEVDAGYKEKRRPG
jgi:hypothetical protein